MATVIDLVSSSPPQSRSTKSIQSRNHKESTNKIYDFDLDEFGFADDLDFSIEQPTKRRRLSPLQTPNITSDVASARVKAAPDISFDDDLLPDLANDTAGRNHVYGHSGTDDLDIVQFSSSAPDRVLRDSHQEKVVFELSSDDTQPPEDVIQSSSQPTATPKPTLSKRTANLLAGLGGTSRTIIHKRVTNALVTRSASADVENTRINRFRKVTKVSAAQRDDIIDSSQPKPAKSIKSIDEGAGLSRNVVVTVAAPKRSAATSKVDRDAAKEAEKERKRRDKELKAQEKQKAADIAEVNKSKTNKKNSTSEMIIDMPASLKGLSAGNQVEEFMKQLDVNVTFSSDEEVNLANDTEVTFGNIITWRRRVTADYDEDLEIWKPLAQPRVSREKHVLVYLKAEEFVNLAVVGQSSSVESASDVPDSTMKTNLDTHVETLRKRYPNCTLIYLIEGLSSWTKRSQSAKNRAYTAAVRSQTLPNDNANDNPNSLPPSIQPRSRPSKSKRKASTPQLDLSAITTDTTETLLLHLQLHHQPCMIHHTTSPATTAAQISSFTQHLSTRPYRLAEQSHNLASASFCMTTGQIRTGATPHEVYINMLQEVNRVTPSMAYGISAAGYKTVGQLVRGFRNEGNLMLEDVRKSVNRDGAWSDKRLGPMVSRRLFRVWMGKDPGARDGIA